MKNNFNHTIKCIVVIAVSQIVILLVAFNNCTLADDPSLDKAISAFLHSTSLVHSYDVSLSGKKTALLKLATEEHDGKKITDWSAFNADETPSTEAFESRQVMADNKKYRTETFDLTAKVTRDVLILNGSSKLDWMPKEKRAFLFKITQQTNLIDSGFHYSELYCNAVKNTSFSDVLSGRNDVHRVNTDQAPSEDYIIEIAPKADALLPAFGWRISLNPHNGFMPTRIERYVGNMNRLQTRIDLREFHQLPVGIAVPIKATIKFFDHNVASKAFGQATEATECEVDLKKSRWNFDAEDYNFTMLLPVGTTVFDNIEQKSYTVHDLKDGEFP